MRGATPTSITSGRKIWTPTDAGRTRRTTVRSGCRMSRMAGLLTAMATGFGSLTTVGRGLATSPGAGRLITTGAGCGTAARGHGGRDRCGARDSIVRSGRRRMCRSSDSEAVWDLGFGFGWGGWGGFGWLPIGPCDRFFPWWGGYGGRFGVVGFNRFGRLNRFGGIAPLHGGTRFSNVAHINDPHIGRRALDGGCGEVRSGRTTAVAATHAQLSGARMMTGQPAGGAYARQFVGERTGGGAFDNS